MTFTGVFKLMMSIAQNLKRAAELLGPKGRMQDDENLNHLDGTIGALFDCTHFVKLYICLVQIRMVIDWGIVRC